MIEWLQTWPGWLQGLWLSYVTFHDIIQWAVMLFLARTAWGERRKKQAAEELITHIHDELHRHVGEDYHRPRIIKRERSENVANIPG